MSGYNFTERVRRVLQLARIEAARLQHEYVGTEHILLGLIEEGEGVAMAVLVNRGIDLFGLRFDIERIAKPGSRPATAEELPYTSRAKKVLEFAMVEARKLNHSYVGTEHLLLGLLREEKGIAAQVLLQAGVTLSQASADIIQLLTGDQPFPDATEEDEPASNRDRPAGEDGHRERGERHFSRSAGRRPEAGSGRFDRRRRMMARLSVFLGVAAAASAMSAITSTGAAASRIFSVIAATVLAFCAGVNYATWRIGYSDDPH